MLDPSDIRSTARSVAFASAIAVLAAFVYLVPAHDTPFYTKGEAREAVLVQAMRQTGNYVLPLRNGSEIPSKPPLFHWLGAVASVGTRGVTELAARLPSVLAAAATLALTAWLGRSLFGSAAGIVAAVVLGSSVTFFVSATTARVDMVLALAVTAALALFVHDYARARLGLSRGFHAAVAAAVLAKGPVGLVLPWAVVVVTLVGFRDLDYARRLGLRSALAWLLLPAAWYAAAFATAGDAFVAKQIVQENFQRLVDAEGGSTGHVKPFYAHLPLLLGGLAPWTVLAPIAVAYGTREGWNTRSRALLPLLAWLWVPLLLFSLAGSKRAVYLLPSYPAVALLIGWWWTRPHGFTAEAIARAARLWAASVTWTAALLVVPLGVLLLESAGVPLDRAIAPLLSEDDRANLAAVVHALGDGRVSILPGVLVALGLVAGLAWSARRQQRTHAIAVAAMLVTFGIVGGSLTLLQAIARTQSVAPFVGAVAWVADPKADWGFFQGVSYPVAFYAERPVPEIDSVADLDRARPAMVFAAGGDLDRLISEAALQGRTASEIGRFTFADSHVRVPLVAVALSEAEPTVGTPGAGR